MCRGTQWHQCPQDLETGCHTGSLLQLHCPQDDVGTQRLFHLRDRPETWGQDLLDDIYWRQISVCWNRLSDSWWRVHFGVCVQAALLAQMKRIKAHIRIYFLRVKLFGRFLCYIRTLDSHGPRLLNEQMIKKNMYCEDVVILVSLYSLSLIH